MATTINSNRKKPTRSAKTTKTAKTTKKTASARAKSPAKTKVATNDKAASVKTKTTVKTAALSPLERLRSLHLSSAFLYIVFGGLVIGFATTTAAAVTLGIQTRDEFASKDSVVLGPAHEVFYNIEPKYVFAASLFVSAIAAVLLATKFRAAYETSLKNQTSGFRWTAIGLSTALSLTFVNMLAGIQDCATLKLSAAMVFVTSMLSWIAERDNVGAARPKWLAYVLALFTGALAWLPLLITFIGTPLYGNERFGWHVYALAAVLLIGCTAFAVNLYRHIRYKRAAAEYPAVESRYMRIDLLTKFAMVIIVLTALQ